MTAVAELRSLGGRRTVKTSIAAAALILDSARRARQPQVGAREEHIFRLANEASDDIEFPVWAVMQSGSLAAVFVVSGGLARLGRRPDATAALATGVGVWAGVKLLKPLIGRGRPEAVLESVAIRGQRQTGLGYPSGHTAVAVTLALAATGKTHTFSRVVGLSIAAATGVARMYMGAHLPLDVAGGLGIGVLCGRTARTIARAAAPVGRT